MSPDESSIAPRPRDEAVGAATDLVLGLAACGLARRMRREPAAGPWWQASYWCTGAAALLGAVHHAGLTRDPSLAHVSWRIIALLVSLAIAMLLIASALQVAGPLASLALAPIAAAGPVAYAVEAVRGGGTLRSLVAMQGLTMAAVLCIWLAAAARRNPAAAPALAGIATSLVAAGFRARPPAAMARRGVDGNAAYHVLQIPGLALLARAARTPG